MPRSYRHWTPRYAWSRCQSESFTAKQTLTCPGLTPEANDILAAWLRARLRRCRVRFRSQHPLAGPPPRPT